MPRTGVNEIRIAYVVNEADITSSMELLRNDIEAHNR